MHLDDGVIQRLADGEPSTGGDAEVRAHIEVCSACRDRLAQAMRENSEMEAILQVVDHPVPVVDPEVLVAQPAPPRVPWLRWAAIVVLGLGISGVAYAAPGSPLRGWVSAISDLVPSSEPTETTPEEAGERQPADSDIGGLAVDPGDRLLIQISGDASSGQAVIRLTNAAELEVRGAPGTASFTSDLERLTIDGLQSGTIQIDIPSSAPRVEIRVGARTVMLKEGPAIVAGGVELRGSGPFGISLGEEGR